MREAVKAWAALCGVAVLTIAAWAAMDRPVKAPDWSGQILGLSYNPSGLFTQSQARDVPPERIERDMAALDGQALRIRTYSVSRGLDRVPEIAGRHGLMVSLGVWLSADREANAREIALAQKIVSRYPGVIDRVFVGNEAVLRGDLTAAEVAAYIRRMKAGTPAAIPVSTAEPWHVWRDNAGLAEPSDFIGAHFLPFWEGAAAATALNDIVKAYSELQIVFWNKPLVIAEAGWPSEGRTFRNAVASIPNQAAFTRAFLGEAVSRNWDFYLIEAFDQPWKVSLEGAVGAYWGIFDAYGAPKFALAGPVSALPGWPFLACAAAFLVLAGGWMLQGRVATGFRGRFFMAGILAAVASGGLAIFHAADLEYAGVWTWALYGLVLPLCLFAAAVLVAEAIEMTNALWRPAKPAPMPEPSAYRPFVSIHVPAYNEPPGMMIETLNALARLDYDRFEVIVLDNNTRDPAVWRPVEEHCKTLGARFRFFHFEGVRGYKAGALNVALKVTDPQAEIVAVIDSDYQVAPHWLKRTAPLFADPALAIVQAPQDYRDASDTAFKAMAYQEYAGFFRIGMVERDVDNAIVQHGTMTMMRKDVLARAGWAEWCITEDTELGLRIFAQGWKAIYLDESLGRGVMPDTFSDFKIQRYRWVYGAMQIFKRHWRSFGPASAGLTPAQKYHFLAGWLPWLSDALSLGFVGAALVWTMAMTLDPVRFDAPLLALGAVAVALFGFKVLKTLVLYPVRVKSGIEGALAASLAGLALSHTVARAVIAGLTTTNLPFIRTPKLADRARLGQVVAMAAEEIAILAALCVAAAATWVVKGPHDPAAILWILVLAIQALPYAATIAVAAVSVWPQAPARAQAKPVAVPAAFATAGATPAEALSRDS
jgi:exo-beta-1,3-glucanase (GH17 family)/cellulose synthase/poly-beta-1,6-N-acetylglucosamine synthase-like glycosyltransferase